MLYIKIVRYVLFQQKTLINTFDQNFTYNQSAGAGQCSFLLLIIITDFTDPHASFFGPSCRLKSSFLH